MGTNFFHGNLGLHGLTEPANRLLNQKSVIQHMVVHVDVESVLQCSQQFWVSD